MATLTDDDPWPEFPLMFERTEAPVCALCHSTVPGFHSHHCMLNPRWWLAITEPQKLILITGI